MTGEEGLEWWKQIDRATPHSAREFDGPAQSKLQLPIPVEKYVDGSQIDAHSKECNLESKQKKITSQDEVDKARQGVGTGLASFSDSMFQGSGGDVLANLKQLGITEIAAPAASPSKFGNEVAVEPKKLAKARHFDALSARVTLEEHIQEGIDSLGQQVKSVLEKCELAETLGKEAAGGEGLEGIQSWMDLLADKVAWVKHTDQAIEKSTPADGVSQAIQKTTPATSVSGMSRYDYEVDNTSGRTKTNDEYLFCNRLRNAVMEAFVSSGLESSEKATAVIELCQSEPFEHSKAYAVMHNAGFNGSGFNASPDYGAITSNLERVMACLRISHRLQAHIDETLDRRAPMPVSEPLLLIPVNALYLMKNAVCCVQSESEFKEIKGEFEKTRTALQELFRAAEGAARQVSGFIDTKRKKKLASENKKMRDDQKEKEKSRGRKSRRRLKKRKVVN